MSGNFCDVFRLVYQRDYESYVNGKKKYTEFMSMFGVVRCIVRGETVSGKKFHIALKFSRWGGSKNGVSGNR